VTCYDVEKGFAPEAGYRIAFERRISSPLPSQHVIFVSRLAAFRVGAKTRRKSATACVEIMLA